MLSSTTTFLRLLHWDGCACCPLTLSPFVWKSNQTNSKQTNKKLPDPQCTSVQATHPRATLWLHVIDKSSCFFCFLPLVKTNDSLNLHLAPSSMPPCQRPTLPRPPAPPIPTIDLCFPAPNPLQTPPPPPPPYGKQTTPRLPKKKTNKTTTTTNPNTSRPKRPPVAEAPAAQRGGRAHHSEGPV